MDNKQQYLLLPCYDEQGKNPLLVALPKYHLRKLQPCLFEVLEIEDGKVSIDVSNSAFVFSSSNPYPRVKEWMNAALKSSNELDSVPIATSDIQILNDFEEREPIIYEVYLEVHSQSTFAVSIYPEENPDPYCSQLISIRMKED